MSFISAEHRAQLSGYTACDIADALLKLQISNAGYLPDLNLITPLKPNHSSITVASASTILFRPKNPCSVDESRYYGDGNIPPDKHWADLTPTGSILVMSQPEHQKCAILGGIMALRLRVLDIEGVVVDGRVRDIHELATSGLSIWAKGTSIIGAGAESMPHAIQITLNIHGTIVKPGDVVFMDHVNGVVVIPFERLDDVLVLLPDLIQVDEHVTRDIAKGVSIFDAFKRHRV